MKFSLFLSGYFWHITDIHYDAHYSTSGNTQRCKYHVRKSKKSLKHKNTQNMILYYVFWVVPSNDATHKEVSFPLIFAVLQ